MTHDDELFGSMSSWPEKRFSKHTMYIIRITFKNELYDKLISCNTDLQTNQGGKTDYF